MKKEERKIKEKRKKPWLHKYQLTEVDISQYTNYTAISRDLLGVFFLVYWHSKPCHGGEAHNFRFYEGLEWWKQPALEEITSNWLSW